LLVVRNVAEEDDVDSRKDDWSDSRSTGWSSKVKRE
jgi:hypothetical protein